MHYSPFIRLLFTSFVLCCGVLLSACTSSSSPSDLPSVSAHPFGTTDEGTPVKEFVLKNSNGVTLTALTYGGIIRTLHVPDREGHFEDIVLGYDSLSAYLEESPYLGAIIGRYGNRIANGTFTLDGETYTLATNAGPTTSTAVRRGSTNAYGRPKRSRPTARQV